MASNALPENSADLFSLATDMLDGLHAHEVDSGIRQNTASVFGPVLKAAEEAEQQFRAADKLETEAASRRSIASSNSKGFLHGARRQLVDDFGPKASAAWETLGFPTGTTAVPRRANDRLKVLKGVETLLTAEPAREIAQKKFSAAEAKAIRTALTDAEAALNAAAARRVEARLTRDAAVDLLRARMISLVGELKLLLKDDPEDPRWYYFGLVPPAGTNAPGIPAGVVGRALGPTAAFFSWSPAPRATSYRPAVQLVGRDADFVDLPLTPARETHLHDLPAGATVNFRVAAYNEAGESTPSETATVVLG